MQVHAPCWMGYPSPEKFKINLLKHKINLRHNPDSSAKWALQLSFSIHDKALITIRRNAAKYIIYIYIVFLIKPFKTWKKINTLGKPFEYNASIGIFKTIYAFHKLSSYLLPALLFTLLRTFYITNVLSSLFFLINPFNDKKRA